MAVGAVKLSRDYGGMDPRVASDILSDKQARGILDTSTLTSLTNWKDVGYWQNQDRTVWDLYEAGEQTVSGISSTAGLTPDEVRSSLDRLKQDGWISSVQEDEEVQ